MLYTNIGLSHSRGQQKEILAFPKICRIILLARTRSLDTAGKLPINNFSTLTQPK